MAKLSAGDYAVLASGPLLFTVIMLYAIEIIAYAVALSSAALSLVALAVARGTIKSILGVEPGKVAAGLAWSLSLYAAFYVGNILSEVLGLGGDVEKIYSLVEPSVYTLMALAVAAVGEEVYWRGAVQEHVIVRKAGLPWWTSSLVYGAAHIASGILVLVVAAVVAGVMLGYAARRWGLAAASASHFAWLTLMFYIAPVR